VAAHNPYVSDLGHKTRELCQIMKVEHCQNLSFLAIAPRLYDGRILKSTDYYFGLGQKRDSKNKTKNAQ